MGRFRKQSLYLTTTQVLMLKRVHEPRQTTFLIFRIDHHLWLYFLKSISAPVLNRHGSAVAYLSYSKSLLQYTKAIINT